MDSKLNALEKVASAVAGFDTAAFGERDSREVAAATKKLLGIIDRLTKAPKTEKSKPNAGEKQDAGDVK